MLKSLSEERKGEMYAFAQVVLYGLLPILANAATKIMPPILFSGIATLVGAFCFLIYSMFDGTWKKKLIWRDFKYILGVTVFAVILPQIFIFWGTSMTSSINTAILLQAEVVATFLICSLFYREQIAGVKLIGSLLMLLGATVVMLDGKFVFNPGDWLVVLGASLYPIGNIFAKESMKRSPVNSMLVLRGLIGGSVLMLISLLFEKQQQSIPFYLQANLFLIVATGVVVFFFSKIFWFEGLRRLEISKIAAINIAVPVFSLIYAYLIFSDIPTGQQWFGVISVMIGMLILTVSWKGKSKTAKSLAVESAPD